ncbi:MAG: tyrosine-type recombinase/integrase, partial [Geminicoccaceae bacterium]
MRREDAIRLERRHIIDDRIYLTKERTGTVVRKTGAQVIIPIHPRLREELARPMPITSVDQLLVTGTRGRPIRGDVLTHSISKEAKRLGIKNPPPVHGLRKNAVMRLIEVGLSKELIKNITG